MTDAPDVVYVVRRGHRNDELRYSLRSLANVPHGRVWLAGHVPQWARAVGEIRMRQVGSKHANAKDNLRAACEHPDVAEEFLYFNDDFFVMRPVPSVRPLHLGPIDEVVGGYGVQSDYTAAMNATRRILEDLGVERPVSYELHLPMLVTKAGMLTALDLATEPRIQERTLFGNLAGLGGRKAADCKVYGEETGWRRWTYISTSDAIFEEHAVGRFIRQRFPFASPHEDLMAATA